MKHTYTIDLLNGEHGIWLFIKKNGKVEFEQPGIKTIKCALDFAEYILASLEKENEKEET